MKRKLLIATFLLFSMISIQLQAQKLEVNSTQVSTLLTKNKHLIILDVRTPEEFAAGHVKGAINIDIRQEDAYSKIDKLNPNAGYLVYCRTNRRSGVVVAYMLQKGFNTVYQMMDGFSGWMINNLTFVK